jgi:D-glycero-alpha-D-manno-heptose-7-phosphate kinase
MIITKAPFRISLFGGGSDLAEYYTDASAAVLSTTIDKYMYISTHKYFDDTKITAKYSVTELVTGAKQLKHPTIRESLIRFGIDGAIEISSIADIPAGTGLGSSSTFTVALLHNLHARQGRYATKEMLAAGACEIEIETLREPIGKQDQYAAAYGGLNVFTFLPTGQVTVEPILLTAARQRDFTDSLLLYYTGTSRPASSILAEQRSNMVHADKRAVLAKMVDLVWKGREALYTGDIDTLGRLLHQSWLWKRELATNISSAEIDAIYAHAISHGATGGKILGAGGGGFLLLICDKAKQDGLRRAMSALREIPFNLENQGSQVIYFCDESATPLPSGVAEPSGEPQ